MISHPSLSNCLRQRIVSCRRAMRSLSCKLMASASCIINIITSSLSLMATRPPLRWYASIEGKSWKSVVLSTSRSFLLASRKALHDSRCAESYAVVDDSSSLCLSVKDSLETLVNTDAAGCLRYLARISSELSVNSKSITQGLKCYTIF